METFKFRSELIGHTSDVRGICCPRDGLLASVSRDMTMRTWDIEGASGQTFPAMEFAKHSKYVTSVSFCPSSHFSNGVILTGSNDNLIRGFVEGQPDPVFSLNGHTGTVCSLDCNSSGVILSGSWDSTARFWDFDSCLGIIQQPDTTIWSVIFLLSHDTHPDEYLVATGSSNSCICIWNIPKSSLTKTSPTVFKTPLKTLRGHTDCVRSLALIDRDRLLSSSNDASIRCWSIELGSCIAEFYGHTSFVYSIAIDPARQFFASAGEDRSVRVWPIPELARSGSQQLECQQTLPLPCQTAWCVTVTLESDIAVGCSDNKIRLFSKNPKTQAALAVIETYEAELASSQVAAGSLGEIEKHNLPGVEALAIPGRSEGEVRVIRENGSLMCYQWSTSASQWLKVGDVVGSADHNATGTNRTLFEGKEYDYVFSVDLGDNIRPVKLPFNKTEDPWMAAQLFIYKHNLSQDYLDQIAKFIITQAGLDKPGTPVVSVGADNSLVDPFTGDGRYVPSTDFKSSAPPCFPSTEYISIESIGIEMVLSKVNNFNVKAPKPLPKSSLSLIAQMNPGMSEENALTLTESILEVVGEWPSDIAFPLFDLLRCLVRWKRSSEAIFQPSAFSKLLHVSGLSRVESDASAAKSLTNTEITCSLFVFRLMVNAIFFDTPRVSSAFIPASLPCVVEKTLTLISKFVDPPVVNILEKKKHPMVALANLVYNLATLAHLHSNKHSSLSSSLPAVRGLAGLCVRMASRLLIFISTQNTSSILVYPPEVPQSLLIALGTAVVTAIPSPSTATSQTEADLRTRRIALIGNAVPVQGAVGASSVNNDALVGWEQVAEILHFWKNCKVAERSVRDCAHHLLKMLAE
nr:phospholipase A 2 activating protein [Hymenolepis microstoma]